MIRFTLTSRTNRFSLNGKIKRRESKKIYVEIFNANKCDTYEQYNIVFDTNRNVYQLQHNALDFVKRHGLFDILIYNPSYHYQKEERRSNLSAHRISSATDLNNEQLLVIDSIVMGDNFPFPYLLYGPPG